MRTRVLLLLVVALAGAGCRSQAPPPAQADRTLRVLMGADPDNLDPHTSFDDVSSVVLSNVYETLVRFDRNMRLEPALAVRWINPDDRTWRFHLDPRARFADGSPLRATDVKFSLERSRSVAGSMLTGFVRHVTDVTVVDDHTIDLHTTQPVAILNGLALIPVVSERYTREGGDARLAREPFGTGPYRVAQWQRGQHIVLEPNPHHPRPPVVRRAMIQLLPAGVSMGEIVSREADLTLYPSGRVLTEIEKTRPGDLAVLTSESLTVYYLSLNVRPSVPGLATPNPLADVRVRQALARAIDRHAIARGPLRGLEPAGQLTVPQVFGHDPETAVPTADAAGARALLAQAGREGVEVVLDTIAGGSSPLEKALIEQWQKAGIKARLRELPADEAAKAVIEGRYQASIEGYSCTSGDASELLTWLLHSRESAGGLGAGNSAGYSNPDVDHIAETNLAVFDARERQRLLRRGLRIVSDEVPYVPLVATRDDYVVRTTISWRPAVNSEVRFEDVRWAGEPQ